MELPKNPFSTIDKYKEDSYTDSKKVNNLGKGIKHSYVELMVLKAVIFQSYSHYFTGKGE